MPAEHDVFWVEQGNHVPSARIMARDARVRWADAAGGTNCPSWKRAAVT
jgi:hypothetical protein